MPWTCKLCGQEATDERVECPGCEGVKTSWTIQEDVTRTFQLPSGGGLRLLRAAKDTGGSLTVRLEIDPDSPLAADDRFLLFSEKGDFPEQLRTVADDQTPDDETTDLVFAGLDRSLRYSLEVDPGAQGDPYLIFDDLPFAQLSGSEDTPPLEVTWTTAQEGLVSDKGTLRDLSRRGASPSPQRLLLVRSARPIRVTTLFTSRSAAEVELEPRDGEVRLLLAYGPGSLDGVAFPQVEVLDVGEETDAGHAPSLEVAQGSGRARELPLVAPPGGKFCLRLEIDPEDPQAADDRFILTSPKGPFAPQVKTVLDDLTPGDAVTDLLFDGLDEGSSYTLEVDPGGDGQPYRIFQDVPYAELAGLSAADAGGEESA